MAYKPRDGRTTPTGPLSTAQRSMLDRITTEWQSIWDVGAANATNLTLSNLERRGLIELRGDYASMFTRWQVRTKAPRPSATGGE